VLSLVSFGTEERKVGGKSSQTRGPETAKLRDPYVIVLVLGTIRSRADKRIQRRPVLAATGTHIKLPHKMELSRVDTCIDNGTPLVRYSLTNRQPV